MDASTADILDFLQTGFVLGLAPNTLRRQVAALLFYHLGPGVHWSTTSHWFGNCFGGAANLCPPVIHHYPSRDLTKVLKALTKGPFEPLKEASLKFLSYKVAFLVAVTSAHQISELAAL